MNILVYQPYNQIVVYIESIAEQFVLDGHQVYFLSHDEPGATHENLQKIGCQTGSIRIRNRLPIIHQIERMLRLVSFCKKNNIDVVYSHFQESNIVGVFAQFFVRAKFVITRHHSDSTFLESHRRQRFADKIINRLAKWYIAPSQKVYDQIVNVEGTNSKKVKLIRYGYNFQNFRKVDAVIAAGIRASFPADLLLVKAARFIPAKRHRALIDAMRTIISKGHNVKLLLMGKGPLEDDLKKYVRDSGLDNNIFFLGFKLNIMDYYSAADLVVHFSISEASNSAIKEAAITNTAVAVCRDVGDFDDYIVRGRNGFTIEKQNPGAHFVSLVDAIIEKNFDLEMMGKALHQDVLTMFDVRNVVEEYRRINSNRP
ncbi:MAG TPA: glycosyltransferase family 4 protein [Chryseosolibacter sp.]|nr:glycosyltransferase family 4 protein [Chryseosolibacter sp.]